MQTAQEAAAGNVRRDGCDRSFDLVTHVVASAYNLSVGAPGPRPGPPVGGLGLDGEMSDSLRLYRLLRLHGGRRQPASAARSPASIFSPATAATKTTNLSGLVAHVIESAYYYVSEHPERDPGLLPGVSDSKRADLPGRGLDFGGTAGEELYQGRVVQRPRCTRRVVR
jgi:hypothetical protein